MVLNPLCILKFSFILIPTQEAEAAWKLTTIKKTLWIYTRWDGIFMKKRPKIHIIMVCVKWLWNLARLYMFLRNMYIPHLKYLPHLFLKIYTLKCFFFFKKTIENSHYSGL